MYEYFISPIIAYGSKLHGSLSQPRLPDYDQIQTLQTPRGSMPTYNMK
jgi:hypothetical protein